MEKKKQRHIAYAVFALLLLAGMMGVGGDNDTQPDTENIGTETSDLKKNNDSESEEIEDVFPQMNEDEEKILEIMNKNMTSTGYVMLDAEKKTYYLYPTNEDFNTEIVMMVAGQKDYDDWNGFVDSMIDASNAISDVLGNGYTYALVNPSNEDTIILAVMDGYVIYDLFND